MNITTAHSGHSLRHSHNIQITELKSDTAKQSVLIAKIGTVNGGSFKQICNLLVIGLRDRYSGSLDSGKKIHYFNTNNTNGNIKITTEGLKTLLNTKIPDKDFTDDDCNLILALCTHRHTSFSSVASYPSKLANMFSFMRIPLDRQDLINLENQLNQNADRLKGLVQDYIILANKNLNSMDLRGDDLSDANLSKANLSKANLSWVNLNKADLNEADLNEANLNDANLSDANLSKANLSKAKLCVTNLSKANLSKANLSKANLCAANLSWVNLNKADLSWAKLSWVNLNGAKLNEADLTNATITLQFTDNLDLDFNHINNTSGSILTAINSIDANYEKLKNDLMQQVVNHLQGKDIASIYNALMDILFNITFDYSNVLENNPEFTQKLLKASLDKGNTQQLIMSEQLLKYYTKDLTKLSDDAFKEMVEA